MKILAVDDDPVAIDILKAMLCALGYTETVFVHDGKDILQIILEDSIEFDCILLDIDMPGMTGVEICRLIRSETTLLTTPIIMMTALRDKESVDTAFRAGATDYINKPLELVDLELRLRAANQVNRKRRSKSLPESEYSSFELSHVLRHETLRVDYVDDLIDYAALCNYLAHLSLAGLETRQVLAVKLSDFDLISGASSEQELIYFLSEIADAIANQLRRYDCMMAYCGDGSFVVVTDKSQLESSVCMEGQVLRALGDRDLEYDDGRKLSVDLAISNPIRPNTSKTQRVRKTFDRALGRAEIRMARKLKKENVQYLEGDVRLRLVEQFVHDGSIS